MSKSKRAVFNRRVSLLLVISLILSLYGGCIFITPAYASENPLSELETEMMGIRIVNNNEPKAVLVIPRDADENIEYSADLLAEYIEKSTGAELQILEDNDSKLDGQYADMARIYVGLADSDIEANLDGMDDDGFIIRSGDNSVTIIGPTTWGTRFGACDFLERYVGVRWLMPGENGEDVPQLQNIGVPFDAYVQEEPAFMMRVFSPLFDPGRETGTVQNKWAVDNRMHWRVDFHHNIYSLFPSSEYATSNPEFYPTRDGERKIPAETDTTSWQPCFNVPATVDIAVEKIIRYFEENPEATSFSLGVNDTAFFCDGTHDDEYAHSTTKINSIGLPDMSDLYYGWVNEVVRQVREVYPDKWFGLLAYQNVTDPPSFALEEHVVPFITKDRHAWIDEEVEAVGKDKMDGWNAVTDTIGWYDYMYGFSYTVPRVYPHLMAENYQYAAENGVTAHYAELYPNWGEGPKPWISAKLQWDPYLDVDELLDEWYLRAVGSEAAPYLKEYYDHWEEFWTVRIKDSAWFNGSKNGTWLGFNNAGYLDLVTNEEIAASRVLLETAVEKAQTEQQKARANILLREFEYYEASALSYPKKYGTINDAETALSLLEDGAMDTQINMAAKREQLIEEFKTDPVLMFAVDPRNYGLRWNGFNPDMFWALVDYLRANEPDGGVVTDRVYELIQNPEASRMKEFAKLLLQARDDDNNAITNPSFETTYPLASGVLDQWSSWNSVSGETIIWSDEEAHTGEKSIKFENYTRGGPCQTIALQPGMLAFRVFYYSPEGTESDATIQLSINLKGTNAFGGNVGSVISGTIPISDTAGEWAQITVLADIPVKGTGGADVMHGQHIVVVNGLKETGAKLYVDDVYVYQAKGYYVSFSAGGGTGRIMTPVNVANGESCAVPANTYYREGYTFAGWKDQNGVSYAVGNTINNVTEDLTLTAQWIANPATITSVEYSGFTSLVSNFAANIPVTVTADNPEGLDIYAGLFVDGELIAFAKVVNAKATIKAPVFTGATAYVAAWFDGGEKEMATKKDIPVRQLPADIWAPEFGSSADGVTAVFFGDTISLSATAAVRINGVPVTGFRAEGNTLYIDAEVSPGQTVEMKGVKYPELFPSYSFTFTVQR